MSEAITASAGHFTWRAASAPDVHAAQAARSVCSTPGALQKNDVEVVRYPRAAAPKKKANARK